jgi:hypothetical protein
MDWSKALPGDHVEFVPDKEVTIRARVLESMVNGTVKMELLFYRYETPHSDIYQNFRDGVTPVMFGWRFDEVKKATILLERYDDDHS